jgi:hypothetical protein
MLFSSRYILLTEGKLRFQKNLPATGTRLSPMDWRFSLNNHFISVGKPYHTQKTLVKFFMKYFETEKIYRDTSGKSKQNNDLNKVKRTGPKTAKSSHLLPEHSNHSTGSSFFRGIFSPFDR